MITEDYVSFETAKLLKEKGFEGFTLFSYSNRGSTMCGHWENEIDWLPKCTLQMAMKWLREVHNLQIQIAPITSGHKNWTFGIDRDFSPLTIKLLCLPTYEDAAEAAIKYCLENLI